ncbi:MAG: hypothetical protein KA369_20710 [Spirochaetes bacterium]|nr:hypothetical protein [Spirochaetota bacterium]
MKKHAIAAVIIGIIAVLGADAGAQQKQKSVMDYYLDLPDEAFYCEMKPENLSKEFKKKQIRKSNLRAGYILARSENMPLEVALFTDAYLGITVVAVNRVCGEGCMCNYFRLLRPSGKGAWADFDAFPSSDEIMKAAGLTEPDYELVLPEIGTDIRVVSRDKKKLLALIGWSGGQFAIKRKK